MKYELQIPAGYRPALTLIETEVAIKNLKDYFEDALAAALNLTRVSAPLFVLPQTGLNDNLSGKERPVGFDILHQNGEVAEVVQSLAKWKRHALHRYGFDMGQGLYTDMNAIRRDEVTDNIHSLYVDQWDWECIISRTDRNTDFLKQIVRSIYGAFLSTQDYITAKYPKLDRYLPEEITIVTSQELEDMYPSLTPQQREYEYVKKHKAIFIIGIGAPLKSGVKHDGRAPDYDDWELNGDLIFYYPVLDRAMELSSMGIRVDANSMRRQLAAAGCENRAEFPFQKAILEDKLPLTIGGGIGQSRLCMFFLGKAHIGEVHASVWCDENVKKCEENDIILL